jgi:hypothetical protein
VKLKIKLLNNRRLKMVTNLQSPRSGNPVPNQFVKHDNNGMTFQSYKTNIAHVDNRGNVTISKDWEYSRTTMKYTGVFLNSSTQEIRQAIKTGEYTLVETIS